MSSSGIETSSATRGRFLIVDQSLRSFQGHHFEYDVSVAEAASRAGWEPIIFSHKSLPREAEPSNIRVVRAFTIIDRPSRSASLQDAVSSSLAKVPTDLFRVVFQARAKQVRDAGHRFTEELVQALDYCRLQKSDAVLLHTLHIWQLERLLKLLEVLPEFDLPSFHIVLRRDVSEALAENVNGMGLKACLERFCASGLYPNSVYFYTDTDHLAAQYDTVSPIRFRTLSIPLRHELMDRFAPMAQRNQAGPKHVVYLGDARREKGYLHLPDMVAGLWRGYAQTGKVKFTIQSNFNVPNGELGALNARRRLAQFSDDVVTLITEPLSPESYYRLLADADIVVLPYDAKAYAARSSGVLAEALSAGKVVVATNETWLAEQLDQTRARLCSSPAELCKAVACAIDNFDALSTAAVEYSAIWRECHAPAKLVSMVLRAHRGMRGIDEPTGLCSEPCAEWAGPSERQQSQQSDSVVLVQRPLPMCRWCGCV